ncbi:hypothetical protein AKJ64_04030 [candidate division MSBL1 archaeon SCGC-AAA259E17]|uniref:Uncharacterized protein n=1 Tax=candidate division MSBL1 archaeon SCGC-AAA259E17 TaxID=1698263 RepID=A0A133UD55_9EURY|nr:hypothetical protein AKJ64_04030 [candidate division MSBL1 archaeon SCGC-AAA259E17]
MIEMGECEICGKEGSRLQVNHQELGRVMVCRDCWKKINEEGMKVWEGTCSASSCGGCTACK